MIKRYTFLKHPFYFVLENSSQMIAGLEKCVAVFHNETTNSVEVLGFEEVLSPIEIKDVEFIKNLRKNKKQVNWIKENQVAFEMKSSKIEQLSFQDEEESSVLELRFQSMSDGNYDVLYFYFKNNIGNFKLSNVNEIMAVTIKEVIQNLLQRQVALVLKANSNNAEIHQKIKGTLVDTGLQEHVVQLELEQFETARANYSYLLEELTEQEEVEFVLSNEAVRKLMNCKISLRTVKRFLVESLELILNKYNPIGFYEISTHDVVMNNVAQKIHKSIKQENLNRTQQFLDRYEKAVRLLLSKNQKITGLSIGENCSPQISPAAISDVLKKHQKKIIMLFQQYPDRWSLIRTHFKPVKNITERFVAVNQAQMGA